MITRSKTSLAALIVALAACATFPAIAGAGKGGPNGGGGGSSVTLVPLYAHSGGPVFGDQVTFAVSSSTATTWVRNQCYQGSTLVSAETHGFFPDYPWGTTYTLGPTYSWTSGGASCRADLITTSRNKTITLASTSYTVAA